METAAASSSPATRPSPTEAVRYNIDPVHATAQFKVRHLMVANVRGHLGEVTGEVRFDPTDPSRSSVNASIDAAGIDTRNPDRDTHLRSPDFLDVANHPAITFRSTAVRAKGPGEYQVDGELTIRSTTRPVTLRVEVSDEIRDPWGNVKRGIEASARIDRKDWGLTWNAVMEGGGILVGDAVEIAIEAELVRG
jgi:polyisoprenoid-binding protein YceI